MLQKLVLLHPTRCPLQNVFLGACMCIGKPSKRFRKSAQGISLSFYLRLFKKNTSAFSAPTQANFLEAGETKHLNTSVDLEQMFFHNLQVR